MGEQVGIADLPFFEPLVFSFGLAVDREESEELEQEVLAGLLEGRNGALETFQELNADEANQAALATDLEVRFLLQVPDGVIQGVIRGEGEERFFFGEGKFDFAQQVTVSLLDGIVRDVRVFFGGKQGFGRAELLLALDDIGTAALDDEFTKQFVAEQDLASFDLIGLEKFAMDLTVDDLGKLDRKST